jgi:hypothetical protein
LDGKYINDRIAEYPIEWFTAASLSTNDEPDARYNFFKVKSRQSSITRQLAIWAHWHRDLAPPLPVQSGRFSFAANRHMH